MLIIDNATSHNVLNLNLTNIQILFIPANTTSKLQPLDNGIISAIKMRYRRKFVKYLIDEYEINFLCPKKLDILGATRLIKDSWDEIESKTIINCWIHSKLVDKPQNNIESEIDNYSELISDLEDLIIQLNVSKPIPVDEHIPFPEKTAIEEINDDLILEMFNNDEESDIEMLDDSEEVPVITANQAFIAINDATKILVPFLEQQNCDMESALTNLKQLRDQICRVWYGLSTTSLSTAVLSTSSLSTRTVYRQPVYRHDRFIETTVFFTVHLSLIKLHTP